MTTSRHDRPSELHELGEMLREIRKGQHTIIKNQGAILMAISQAVIDVLAALDKATNDIAAEITKLAAQIGTGMSQADVDSVVTQLQAKADKLETLAVDPANPVPAPVK